MNVIKARSYLIDNRNWPLVADNNETVYFNGVDVEILHRDKSVSAISLEKFREAFAGATFKIKSTQPWSMFEYFSQPFYGKKLVQINGGCAGHWRVSIENLV